MARLFANNAAATLAAGIASGATSIVLASGTGALFPSPTAGDYFELTLTNAGSPETSWEVVQVTARTTDTLTVVRGFAGTTAAAWLTGAKAELRVTADVLASFAAISQVQTFAAAQRGAISVLSSSASITPDFALGNFFSLTLAVNSTLNLPSNLVAGQSGSIFITQDATGSRTLAYNAAWDWAGGTVPALSTAANAVDRLDYVVRTTGSILAVISKGWA